MKLFNSKKDIILWWVIMVILVFILSAVRLFGQASATICTTETPDKLSPAPCSIEGVSQEKIKYVIQVGVYRNKVTPMPYTMVLKVGDLYYYYLNRIFDSKESAQTELDFLRTLIDRSTGKPLYCDAFVTQYPIKDVSFFE